VRNANVLAQSSLHLSSVEVEEERNRLGRLLSIRFSRSFNNSVHSLRFDPFSNDSQTVKYFITFKSLTRPILKQSLIVNRMENLSKISDYCHLFYHPTYTRISPYIIGILLGCLLHKTKDRVIVQTNKVGSFFCLHFKKYFRLPLFNNLLFQYVLAIGWIISTLLALSALFGLALFLNEYETPVINSFVQHSFVRVFYGAFHRTGFALSFAWVIFACTHNYGGIQL